MSINCVYINLYLYLRFINELPEFILCSMGGYISYNYTMKDHKIIHFIGVLFWLYGKDFLNYITKHKWQIRL